MQSKRVDRRDPKDYGDNGGTLLAVGLSAAAVIGAVGYGVYSLFKGRPTQEEPHQYRSGQSRSRDGSVLICVICLGDMNSTNIKHLRCGHGFHNACIAEWFAKEGHEHTCPCCRNRHMSF